MAALPNVEAPSVVTATNPGDHIIQTPGGNTLAMRDAAQSGSSAASSSGGSSSDDSSDDPDVSVTGKTAILLSSDTASTSLNLGATRSEEHTSELQAINRH